MRLNKIALLIGLLRYMECTLSKYLNFIGLFEAKHTSWLVWRLVCHPCSGCVCEQFSNERRQRKEEKSKFWLFLLVRVITQEITERSRHKYHLETKDYFRFIWRRKTFCSCRNAFKKFDYFLLLPKTHEVSISNSNHLEAFSWDFRPVNMSHAKT